MSNDIDPTMLHQHWMHSHEEDTEDEMVYRPIDYKFPPARKPRKAFELCEDGTMVSQSPGPADRPVADKGQWKLVDDQMVVFAESESEPHDTMTIKSVAAEKLVLRKDSR